MRNAPIGKSSLFAVFFLWLLLLSGIAAAGRVTVQNGQLNVTDSLGSSSLFVNSTSGKVGINTSSPNATLHVVGGSFGYGGDRVYDIVQNGIAYRVHVFTTVGNSTFTPPTGVTSVEYLVVGGGGSGANGNAAARIGNGGGAGGFRNGTLAVTAQAYSVVVGAGGPSVTVANNYGIKGGDSVFSSITAYGGGGFYADTNTGSGCGGAYIGGITEPPGNGTVGQGNNGGAQYSTTGAGGGGGAAANGSDGTSNTGGAGGAGLSSSINGTLVYYAGGGGGGGVSAGGAGSSGGGGAGAGNAAGTAGASGTGGGGGGTGYNMSSGAGGSGIVILRYPYVAPAAIFQGSVVLNGSVGIGTSSPASTLDLNGTFSVMPVPFNATGGNVTEAGGYRIHTFTTNGTFTPNGVGNVEVLVVAGGGGGGGTHSGGGGGGGVVYGQLFSVSAQAYPVVVGAGGARRTTNGDGYSGQNSSFSTLVAVGGGGGGYESDVGFSGGSGGGSGGKNNTNYGLATQDNPTGAVGYGNNGARGMFYGGGGGGGAGSVGLIGTTGTIGSGGNGGSGRMFSISGTAAFYGGGGGGCGYNYVGGAGGIGGGGAGGNYASVNGSTTGFDGSPNTGGGGGGGYLNATNVGSAGGSGVVIIRYPLNPRVSVDGSGNLGVSGNINVSGNIYSSGNIILGTSSPSSSLQLRAGNVLSSSVGHVLPQTGGSSWFDANAVFFGVENTAEYMLAKNTTYTGVTYRKPSGSITGKWWLLFVENTGGNNWTVRFAARFSLPMGSAGDQVTQNFSQAEITIGSPTTSPIADYYIAWKSGVANYAPTGAFYVDSTSGGGVDYVQTSMEPIEGGIFTPTAFDTGYRMHITVTASSNPVLFSSLDTTGSPALNILSRGYVGIGTAAPATPLEISVNGPGDGYQQPALRLSNLNPSGVGPSLEWYSGLNSKIVGRMTAYGSGTNGGAFRLDLMNDADSILTNRIAINNAGNVGIGTISPSYTLTVAGTAWVTSGAWSGSDARWKRNVTSLLSSTSLDKILALRPVNFEWNTTGFPNMGFTNGTQVGFIAQEVEKVIPEVVTTDNRGFKGMSYERIAPVVVSAMQAQQKRIDALEADKAAKQAQIDQLKALVCADHPAADACK